MSSIWIIVANSAIARVFEASSNKVLLEIHQLTHPESRLYVRDMVSDRQGRGFQSIGTRRSAMEPHVQPKETEFTNFARELSSYLNDAYNEGKFKKLYVLAGPHFLGILRDLFTPAVAQTLAGEINKDITQLNLQEIRDHLPDVL